MQKISQTMGPAQWVTLIVLSILWGGSFFFVEVAVGNLPPFTIVLLRVGLAAVTLHLYLLASGARMKLDLRLWGAFLIMGFLNNVVPFSLLVYGQTQIASGLAAILNATTPLFTVIVVHFMTADEKMTGGRLAGALTGFAGVIVMIGPEALDGLTGNLAAQIACLGAALSYAFAGAFGRRFARLGVTPVHTATGQVTASSILLLPLVLLTDQPWALAMPGLAVWASIAALAVASTALAYILYFRLLSTAGATNLLLVTLLVPVSAILLGASILGERLDPEHIAGMVLIALGLAFIDGRPARALARLVTARSG
jgi:drug/metabolite transporter (DMT)-like permease